jgi:two-component system response regulator
MTDPQEFELVLVEDNPQDAELTLRALARHHLANRLVHLKDGAEALDYFFPASGDAPAVRPRLVLLDLKLPKVDGIEVLRRLKGTDTTRTIPVVVLTSSEEDRDIVETYRLGVNAYVVKPVTFDGIVKAVTDLGAFWLLLNKAPR